MAELQTIQAEIGWQPYHLDHYAQQLVLENRNKENVLNESHKMRMAVAYGLERFWGEHLRLMRESQIKGQYWKSVWDKLTEILNQAGIDFPNDDVTSSLPSKTPEQRRSKEEEEKQKITVMVGKIWALDIDNQRVALMVLTQFCDALVWWTQRYKKSSGNNTYEG